MTISLSDLSAHVAQFFWPFARISAMVAVAPIFGATLVPVRIRILIALGLTVLIAPVVPIDTGVEPISAAGVSITAQQVLIGVAMGFTLQMVFDALIVAGQAIAMSMGLGFAMMVDPTRGISVPVVSQYFLILATLVFLSMDGHLVLVDTLARSFHSLPVSAEGIGREGFWRLVLWGGQMFSGAVRIALPAMTALLIVNIAFGVMSRAAPTLNLFAVGFPITMGLGFIILLSSLPDFPHAFERLLQDSYTLLHGLVFLGANP